MVNFNATQVGLISIHALREEGDTASCWRSLPRPEFLSTPSARRATGVSVGYRIDTIISIHALREEGDAWTGKAAANQ